MATIGVQPAERWATAIVWDGWVRAVHWLIALLFAASWYTHHGNLEWHRYSGYALLTLVLFRIYWGFAGSTTARFAHFVKGPSHVLRYARMLLRRGPATLIGHNPIGAISVVLLLGVLLAQCVIGLFVTDVDGLESGPLSSLVSFDTSRSLAEWHGRVFTALQGLVAIHLAAVAFYFVAKRDDLVTPMVTGRKRLDGEPPPFRAGDNRHAVFALLVIAAAVWAVVRNG